MFGRLHVLPLVRSFLDEYPQVDVRLLLLDRVVSLVDEGLDLGVRIGQLPDSSLRAVRVGQVRRVVCASSAIHCPPRRAGDAARPRQPQCGGVHSRHARSRPLVVPPSERRHFRSRHAAAGGEHHCSGGRRGARQIWGLPASCPIRRSRMRRPADCKPSSSNTNRRPRPFTSCIRKAGTFRPRSAYFSTTSPKGFDANSLRRQHPDFTFSRHDDRGLPSR